MTMITMSLLWLSLRFVLRDIRFRKFISMLAVLAIACGVAALVSLRIVSASARAAAGGVIEQVFVGELAIYGEGLCDIPEFIVHEVEDAPGVDRAIPMVFVTGYMEGVMAFIFGVKPEDLDYILECKVGRKFADGEENVVIVDELFAERRNISVGDTVFLKSQIGSIAYPFKVVGIANIGMKLQGLSAFSTYVVIPLKDAQKLIDKDGFVTMVMIIADKEWDTDQVEENLKTLYPNANILRREEVLGAITQIISVIDGLLSAVTIIGVAVAVFGTSNTIMSSVREHAREIAVLRAIGAKSRDVVVMFMLEATIFGAAGGAIGSLLGVVLAELLRRYIESSGILTMSLKLDPLVIALGFTSSIAVSILSSTYPVLKASRVKPLEVLKNE